MSSGPVGEQLALVREQVRRSRTRPPEGLSEHDPVARVAVDVGLPHLDRPFDYSVPASMADDARPGVRVRVRFAGRLVDGWVLERRADTDAERRLARLARVVSPDPVLTTEVLALCRAVAQRYAGSLVDVLGAAVPPRHAATEAELRAALPRPAPPAAPPDLGAWQPYAAATVLSTWLATPTGASPRLAWSALPGEDWAGRLAELATSADAAGRGAVLVVPDARDVRRLAAALTARGVAHETLTAEAAPSARYMSFLRVRHGAVRVVVGTRAAAYAPVADPALLVLWDDGDDSLADPRAPYWHAREVLSIRAQQSGAALLVGSYARSVEVARAVRTGWLTDAAASRAEVRARAPRVEAVGGDDASERELARDPAARTARLPHTAFEVAREALADGPVLVQVPRGGYVPVLVCARCREPARCGACGGPLALTGGQDAPVCRWCGTAAARWRCSACGGERLRAAVTGARRTAEELGLAFRGVPVRTSGREGGSRRVLDEVPPRPALVVATPGAEPIVAGGYAAALLLDGRALLDRADLRAGEEAVRRWIAAATLVRAGATVVLVAPASDPAAQALVRWDPAGHADRVLAERTEAGLPPAARSAELVGEAPDVADLLATARLPHGARLLGPAPYARPVERGSDAEVVRALVTVPAAAGLALAHELHAAASVRSAAKRGGPVTVRIDPVPFG